MHERNRREVEHVARGRVEAAHAALAENHLAVALGEDVLRAQQQIVIVAAMPRLSSTGLPSFPTVLQQRIVLHVARADLDAVGVLGDESRALFVHRLGDDRQSRFLARACEQLEPLDSEPLERVRRAARLERAAAQRTSRRRARNLLRERMICSSDSTEHGPAMIGTSRRRTTRRARS